MRAIATLHVEPELDDVAVLHDVFFAFDAEFTRFAGFALRAEGDEIVEGNGFGGDEAAFEIAVDESGLTLCSLFLFRRPKNSCLSVPTDTRGYWPAVALDCLASRFSKFVISRATDSLCLAAWRSRSQSRARRRPSVLSDSLRSTILAPCSAAIM